jgi:hypothetical protein
MARMPFFKVLFRFDSTGIAGTDSINPNETALNDFFCLTAFVQIRQAEHPRHNSRGEEFGLSRIPYHPKNAG